MRNENEFYKFLENSKHNKNCAAFGISYFCAIISHQLLVHYEWNSDVARDTMLFLSLFHDISLLNPELTKIRNDLDMEKLSAEDRKMVLNHADNSATIVEQFNNVPFGLTQLIREHHGNKDGVGFSQSLSLNVSPMIMTFIVIEEFGLRLMDYVSKNPNKNEKELKRQIKNIMNSLEQSFSKLTYQKTVQILRELLDKLNFI
jgi:response regulator RpfG family c-di-GMP phosphodiesterase